MTYPGKTPPRMDWEAEAESRPDLLEDIATLRAMHVSMDTSRTAARKSGVPVERWEAEAANLDALIRSFPHPSVSDYLRNVRANCRGTGTLRDLVIEYHASHGHDTDLSGTIMTFYEGVYVFDDGKGTRFNLADRGTFLSTVHAMRYEDAKGPDYWCVRPVPGAGDFALCAVRGDTFHIVERSADKDAIVPDWGDPDRIRSITRTYEEVKGKRSARLPMLFEQPRRGPERFPGRDPAAVLTGEMRFAALDFPDRVSARARSGYARRVLDAFSDLGDVLGASPQTLSMNGQMSLSWQRGGDMKTSRAVYRPGRKTVSFNLEHEGGSVAHEWFHALDHAVGGGGMATGTPGSPFEIMIGSIREGTGILSRSAEADRALGQTYYTCDHEMGARCFEAWIEYRLEAEGRANPYLVSFEENEKSALLHVSPEFLNALSPYPLLSEMPQIDRAMSALFGLEPVEEPAERPAP